MAYRYVCKHPDGNGYAGTSRKTLAEVERQLASLVGDYCAGSHAIEEWRDGEWVEISLRGPARE